MKYQFLKNINESLNKINEVKKYYEKESSIKGPFMPPTAKIFFWIWYKIIQNESIEMIIYYFNL